MSQYKFHGYTPHQRDLVYITFNPSVGREIQKRRPALVISSDAFNLYTGFVAVCPITSRIRSQAGYINLHANKIKGQIVAMQFRTMDFISSDRNIEFIEQAGATDFMKAARVVKEGLGFSEIIGNI